MILEYEILEAARGTELRQSMLAGRSASPITQTLDMVWNTCRMIGLLKLSRICVQREQTDRHAGMPCSGESTKRTVLPSTAAANTH